MSAGTRETFGQPGGPVLAWAKQVGTQKGGDSMRFVHCLMLPVVCVGLALASSARAEVKVELKGVHLCCGNCVKSVGTILKDVEGVKAKCDQKAKTVTITAPDAKTAQKALDALAAGGFQGDTGQKDLAIKDDSGAVKGKVKSVSVSGVHNCCGNCCKAIKETVKKVDGVKADTAKPKMNTFEVTGDFDAAELVKALNAAGFHVKVKK
jgi:copper chaperone CopZ